MNDEQHQHNSAGREKVRVSKLFGRINHTDTRCKLCNAADEDIIHFLLHCTAYTHRSSLHRQITHVKQHFSVQFQQEVDNYFTTHLPDNEQCAHLLSRTLPTSVNPHQHTLWQAMWYTIFHKFSTTTEDVRYC